MKKICPQCKKPQTIDQTTRSRVVNELKNIMDEGEINQIQFYKWEWCEHCKQTWYLWRMWVHEVLVLGDFIEKQILELASVSELTKTAIWNWMITILQDAIIKAAMWETTLEEALKLI